MKAFVSYSHNDRWALDRLHTRLAMLRREGQIVEWFDREILAGGDIDLEISGHLDGCNLFLPLVSPDFLASDYCYNREMKQALARHETNEIRVIPIIIEPCDWKASPLGGLKAVPRDAKPVSEWTNENNAFLDVVTELRRILSDNAKPSTAEELLSPEHTRETRNYRVKRDFDDIDRSDFRHEAFDTICNYFQGAIVEIDGIEGLRGRFVLIGPQSFYCTVVNQVKDQATAYITVHQATQKFGLGDIYFSFSENASEGSANGGFSVESDDYDLFLKPNMFDYSRDCGKLTAQQSAELLWTDFLDQAGVSYD